MGEVVSFSSATSGVPQRGFGYSASAGASSGPQDRGSTDHLSGVGRFRVVYCPLVAKIFFGHLSSRVDLVPIWLLLGPLQFCFLKFFGPIVDPPSVLIPWLVDVKSLVLDCSSLDRLRAGNPFAPPPPSLTLSRVASRSGWSVVLPPRWFFGPLVEGEVPSFYYFSRATVLLALREFFSVVRDQSVLVRPDNKTALTYFNHQGGTLSLSLCCLALELWEWCIPRGVHLSATHILGEEYLLADFLPRGQFLPSEWKLKTSVFQRVCQVLHSPLEIDLFASLLFFQLPKYCARFRVPLAWKIDTLLFPWSGLRLYAFPSFSILP